MGVERCVRDFASLPFCGIRVRACVGLMGQNVLRTYSYRLPPWWGLWGARLRGWRQAREKQLDCMS